MSNGQKVPDTLPDNPTSPEAHRMVLDNCDGDQEKAEAAAYMSGYFDAEGMICQEIRQSNTHQNGYEQRAKVAVQTAQQMAGFFDGEGCITANTATSDSCFLGYEYQLRVKAEQNPDETLLKKIFESYCSLFDVDYTINKRSARDERHSPTVSARVHGEDVEAFLRPLIPILREKRRQAIIMVEEILPRYLDGVHLTKRGFIEMMEWKEKLDKEKPMGNEDRKYTVEYFKELWADDIEAQQRLTDYAEVDQ